MKDTYIQGSELWDKLKEFPSDIPPAIVFNAHITGLAIARSLGKEGIPVIALDRDGRAVGLQSKYVGAGILCPNPLTDEEGFISLLLEIGKRLPLKGVLFPCNDEWVLTVSRHREKLQQYYHFPFADYDIVEPLLNKHKLYKKAEELGIPHPKTWYPGEWESPEALSKAVPYPCIIKPVEQRSFYEAFQKKAILIENPQEFQRALSEVSGHGTVVQEIVGSSLSDFYSLCTYVDPDGEVKGYFTGRKLEQYPQNFGTGCLVESSPIDEFVPAGTEILQTAGYYGISETEFVYDSRDQTYKLLDVNTRVWKWIGLPVFAGVNLPLLAYSAAAGRSIEKMEAERDYAKWVYVQDYLQLKQEKGTSGYGHLTDEELLSVVTGQLPSENLADAVIDADDPLPSVRQVKNQYQNGYICPC
ncbi:carboxylate--amine ligase [Bacillus lacus]|uniref:Carboxylate--amine ligase n=1 Tax=Metabacillus lacus TaxID=1983721 RepID=A0A7X2IZP1_9BACI|nr:carboxylate--amine ligase [Metabacillus lacus]MRX72103.1 carboxylate--amine ligase [Metabacillus lacus]